MFGFKRRKQPQGRVGEDVKELKRETERIVRNSWVETVRFHEATEEVKAKILENRFAPRFIYDHGRGEGK